MGQIDKEKEIMAVRKTKKGTALKKWFREEWTDVKTGKPCGRSGPKDKRKSYPACRPKSTANEMSDSEKKANASKKTSSKRISWTRNKDGVKKKKR